MNKAEIQSRIDLISFWTVVSNSIRSGSRGAPLP